MTCHRAGGTWLLNDGLETGVGGHLEPLRAISGAVFKQNAHALGHTACHRAEQQVGRRAYAADRIARAQPDRVGTFQNDMRPAVIGDIDHARLQFAAVGHRANLAGHQPIQPGDQPRPFRFAVQGDHGGWAVLRIVGKDFAGHVDRASAACHHDHRTVGHQAGFRRSRGGCRLGILGRRSLDDQTAELLDRGIEFFGRGAQRLREAGEGAQIQRLLRSAGAALRYARKHDDRHRTFFHDLCQEFHSAHSGHFDVECQYIGAQRADHVAGFVRTARGADHFDAFGLLQDIAKQRTHRGTVIYHQDLNGAHNNRFPCEVWLSAA